MTVATAPAKVPVTATHTIRPGVNVRNILDTLKDISDACSQAKEDVMKKRVYLADETPAIKQLHALMAELDGYDTNLTGKARPVEVNPTEPVKA